MLGAQPTHPEQRAEFLRIVNVYQVSPNWRGENPQTKWSSNLEGNLIFLKDTTIPFGQRCELLRDKNLPADLEHRIWSVMMLSEERKPCDLIDLFIEMVKEKALFQRFDDDLTKFVGISPMRQNQ